MKSSGSTVFLILELCLISAIAVEVLPQAELRELDIFTQEEHQEITRAKRTDEDIVDEAEYSGEAPLPEADPVFNTEENDDQKENSTNETPPENPDSSSDTKTEPPSDTVDSGSEGQTELPTIVTESSSLNISEIQPIIINYSGPTSGQLNNTDSSKQESELAPPVIESRSGITANDTSEVETTQATTEMNPPEIARAVTSPNTSDTLDGVQDATLSSNSSIGGNASDAASTNATLNNTQNITDPPPQTVIPDSNSTVNSTIPTNTANATDNNLSTSNTTSTSNNTKTDNSEPPKVNSSNMDPKEATTTKPVVGESDQAKQGSVSGSGVMITIVVLLVIAGLAGAGYVIYKKRSRGYTPVNVNDDQGKEMNEIENGFGKPIRADEVRLEDQLTPTQPMAAPRTFMTPPTAKKLHDVDVIMNNDRNTREETIEIEDETKKEDDEK